VMLRFKILPKSYLYTNDYSSKTNPNVINSFATAAFRMHTLVPVNINNSWFSTIIRNWIKSKNLNFKFRGFMICWMQKEKWRKNCS
jgi:hypothetical protein